MSIKLLDLFSVFPIQENIVRYLSAEDLETLSSLGGEFENFYFEFNRGLLMYQYDDKFYSKFRNIQTLILMDSVQEEVIPLEKLSVLLSLTCYSINKEKINLRKCKRLRTLSLKFTNLENIRQEDFPVSLKYLGFNFCKNMSHINMNHLINIKEIRCPASYITDAAINNFPVSVEIINLEYCNNISVFNIRHLINLKKIYCNNSSITDAAINNFPESLELINLSECRNISNFNIHHLVNLKQLNCNGFSMTQTAISHLPVSLEEIDLIWCQNISDLNTSHLVNLKKRNYTIIPIGGGVLYSYGREDDDGINDYSNK